MITDLRFVERDGKRILQYNEQCGNSLDWHDVPLFQNEPTVTITRTQFLEVATHTWETDFDKTRESPEKFSLRLAHNLGLGLEP